MNAIENQLESSSNEIDSINLINQAQDARFNDVCGYVNYGYDYPTNSASISETNINLTASRNNTRIYINGTTGIDNFLYCEEEIPIGTCSFRTNTITFYMFGTTIVVPAGGSIKFIYDNNDIPIKAETYDKSGNQ